MIDKDMTPILTASAFSPELASRNTELAVLRTRMSADRTLMSVIRVSLALIGFGFTIAQVFQNLAESTVIHGDLRQ
jgi:putative membrane protein